MFDADTAELGPKDLFSVTGLWDREGGGGCEPLEWVWGKGECWTGFRGRVTGLGPLCQSTGCHSNWDTMGCSFHRNRWSQECGMKLSWEKVETGVGMRPSVHQVELCVQSSFLHHLLVTCSVFLAWRWNFTLASWEQWPYLSWSLLFVKS